ncbi:Uncharacterised protein [Serratia liquefaciens]|nr:Uncharacterised protein [Serratia liquefaciens]
MFTKEERRLRSHSHQKCKCGCGNTATHNSDYCTGHEPQECLHDNSVMLVDWEGNPRNIIRCLDCGEENYL